MNRLSILFLVALTTTMSNNNLCFVHGFSTPPKSLSNVYYGYHQRAQQAVPSSIISPRCHRYHQPRRQKQCQVALSSTRIRPDSTGRPMMPVPSPAAGLILSLAVILLLAVSDSQLLSFDFVPNDPLEDIEKLDDVAKLAVENVVDAAIPQSTADVITVALGESIGGIVGAGATGIFNVVLKKSISISSQLRQRMQKSDSSSSLSNKDDTSSVVRGALAETDFFIAKSAAFPILEAAGLPTAVASLSSVLFGAIRYEFVKIGYQWEDRKRQEDLLMAKLLKEDQQRKKEELTRLRRYQGKNKNNNNIVPVDPQSLVPVVGDNKIDVVDIFSDITRWLGYDVLKNDFGDKVDWNGILLSEGASSGLYGCIAALSAQIYADVLYRFFQYGPEDKQAEVRSRSVADWAKVYVFTGVSSAALFGIYELARRPVSQYILGILSLGVESCVGSEQYDLCVDTYIRLNPPGASYEAQFRALMTNLFSVGQQLQYVAADENIPARVGALAVSLNSFLHNILP